MLHRIQYGCNNDLTAQSNPFDTTFDERFTASPTSWAQQDTYDTLGNQLTSTDAMGNITRNAYNSYGQLTSQTDPLGNTTTYQYDNSGNLVSTTDPAGNKTTSSYNTKGNLTATYNAAGLLVGSFAYDAAGRLSSETDASGKTTTLSYDANGNQLGSSFGWTDPADPSNTQTITTGTTYNSANQPVDTTDEFGHVTHTDYNADGQVIDTIDAEGEETKYVYDINGNTIQTLNPDGTITDTVYDADNRVVWTDDAHLPGQPAKGMHTIYDGLGNVIETDRVDNVVIAVTTTNGVSQSTFTSSGSVLTSSTTMYNPDGSVASATDESGQTTSYTYDADGRQLTVTEQNVLVWDAGTQNNVTVNLITTYTYDAAGRQSSVTDPEGNTTSYLYDADGRVIKTTYADGSTTSTTYDANGNKSTDTDQIGHTTTYKYNAAGELVEVDQPQVPDANNGNALTTPVTRYTYDNYGNELTQTDADGHTTTFTYDAFGKQLTRTLPGGEVESFTYDSYGRVATHTDFDGNVATSTYFPADGPHAGLLQQVVYTAATNSGKANQTVTYTYDDEDRLATLTDASGTTTYSYDADGNVIEENTPEGDIHYVFNAQGEHSETSTDNTDTTYGYDSLGRLTSVSVNQLNGQTLGTPLLTTDFYDADGNQAAETLANGVLTTDTYDMLNRLIGVTETKEDGSPLFTQTFTLYADGSRQSSHEVQLQDDNSTFVTTDTTWTYDALVRLTGESVVSTAANESYTDTYTYDLVGNQITDTHTGPGKGANATTTNTYNADDQLITSVANGVTTQYGYDLNGSQTTVTVGGTVTANYIYDVRNKMVGYSSNTISATYVYDDAGNRVQETTSGTTTYYLTDTQNPTGYAEPIEAKTSPTATPTTTYILGNRVIAQADNSGAVSYLLTDGHGSTQQITNSAGAVTQAVRYDAYGIGINISLSVAGTAFLFGGDAIYDPASGLYMHGDGTRDRIGFRFIQADTQGNGSNSDPISLHKYLYAGTNPIIYNDPSGRDIGVADLMITAGISGIIGGIGEAGIARALHQDPLIGAVAGAELGVGYVLAVAEGGPFGAFRATVNGVVASCFELTAELMEGHGKIDDFDKASFNALTAFSDGVFDVGAGYFVTNENAMWAQLGIDFYRGFQRAIADYNPNTAAISALVAPLISATLTAALSSPGELSPQLERRVQRITYSSFYKQLILGGEGSDKIAALLAKRTASLFTDFLGTTAGTAIAHGFSWVESEVVGQ